MRHSAWTRTSLVALLVSAAALLSAAGHAQAAPSAADQAMARRLVKEAKRLALEKRFQQALDRFNQAYHYWPRREIQFNIALVYLQVGNKLKAYEHLQRFLEASPAGTAAKLPEPLLRLRSEVGTIRVSTPGQDLEIFVNGRFRGRKTVSIAVLPGTYRVELRKDGRTVQQKDLRVVGGAVVVWEAEIVRARPRGITPGHVEKGGGSARPSGSRKKLHWAYFVVTGAIAVVAGAALVGTGVKTLKVGDEFEKQATVELQTEGNRYKLATNILVGVSAVAGLTAAVLAFFTRWKSGGSESATSRVSVRPGVAPGGASVAVDIAF